MMSSQTVKLKETSTTPARERKFSSQRFTGQLRTAASPAISV